MSLIHDVLWLCANPRLRRFDQPLLEYLNRDAEVRCWEYSQTSDKLCCIEAALLSLHDYIQQQSNPVHLLGHSLSGVIGLLYARRYPSRIKSLTLLSVGANPSASWHAHYYALREQLLCNRKIVLTQMVRLLFGPKSHAGIKSLSRRLAQVLDTELAPHSLAHRDALSSGRIVPPLLICHEAKDMIVEPNTKVQWNQWLKPDDLVWKCPQGRHFFHNDYPQQSSRVIVDFWQQVADKARVSVVELAP